MEIISSLPSARAKLLSAAVKLMRKKGYDSTTVGELCKEADVTKGAFFHHFASKEALGVAATTFWTAWTSPLFDTAPYHGFKDPLDQLIGYIDFRRQILQGQSLPESTCLLGILAQEKFETSPVIRDACFQAIATHADHVGKIIAAAQARHAPQASWHAESLALYTQAVIQGAFVLAKAKNDVALAADMILHLRRYFELLFHHAKED